MNDKTEVLGQALELAHEDRFQLMIQLANSLGPVSDHASGSAPLLETITADITIVPADAMITAINSSGHWGVVCDEVIRGPKASWRVVNPNSLDAAIFNVAGPQYHQQARQLVGAAEGETLIAARQQRHNGNFGQVLFVVDDWKLPMDELIEKALRAADSAGLSSVTLPLIRTGAGARDGATPAQKTQRIVRAVRTFRGTSLRRVLLVAGSPQAGALLEDALSLSGPKICLMIGDITVVDSDGLITAINSGGFWSGGVDNAIYRSSGIQFHGQAACLLRESEGTTLVAAAQAPHDGAFRHVVFVVDDLTLPLFDVLTAGLNAADDAGLTSVTIPAMRMGVMMQVGGSPEGKIRDMARAVQEFRQRARMVTSITFVIYGDPITFEALREELREFSDASAG